MSKKLLKIVLCSLMLGGVVSGVTSCKDYDDEIAQINGTTDRLTQQLTELNAALDAANKAAAAAEADAKVAAEKGDKAAADAAAAKQAAEEAKAAALAEVIKQTDALRAELAGVSTLSNKNAEELAALAGRIEGIENGLSNIDLADVNAQLGKQAEDIVALNRSIEAINVQIEALNNYKTKVDNMEATVNDLVAQLNDLKTKDLATINEQLSVLSAKITTEVSNAVNTIAGVIAQRLTSVTLIPKLYVDGIPTISFESAKYVKKVHKNNQWVNSTEQKNTFIITNNETEAEYRLNPGTVTENDVILNQLAYVSRVATARSNDVIDDIINVHSATVSGDGILTVKLGKSNTESLNRSGNEINTVSLKVPIAAKHLFTEQGETSASVYSEFTRLEETYFTPELRFDPASRYIGDDHPYVDSLRVYNAVEDERISKVLVYNQTYDLYDLVCGCKGSTSHTPLTREQLQAYGMDIRFHVATAPYAPTSPDMTNQQKFVKLSGENNSILTPVTSTGQTGNEVIVGKQPIIAATLFDATNNNVIEVRYFKVKFDFEQIPPVEINWDDIVTTGNPCEGAIVDITWDQMASRVLEKMNVENGVAKGMSKEEFTQIYGGNIEVSPANDENGRLDVKIVSSSLDASIPVMTWSVTPAQLGRLVVGQNTVTFTKRVTFNPTNSKLHEVLYIDFKWTVKVDVAAATLGDTDPLKWQNNTMKVFVVPMQIPYTKGTSPKAYYNTNILEGRTKPYVKGLLNCAYYDVDYAVSGNPAYTGEALSFQNGFGHWMMNAANQANLNEIHYTIANTPAGKQLASKGATIKLDWKSNINGLSSNPDNRYVFATTNLEIVPILKLETTAAVGFTDNSRQQTINLSNNLRIKDAYGNVVAKVASAGAHADDYWDFYGVKDPVYGTVVNVADDAAGTVNVRTLASLNMTANVNSTTGDLTFQNNGAPLQGNAFLLVPVTVEHLWGTLEGHVAVPLNKSLAAPRR